jgi:tRNA A22 N-methylase
LAAARRNQVRFELPLELHVGVGLSPVQERQMDSLTMAGMGADEIVATLSTAPPGLRWAGFQPHRGADVLRSYLHQTGWTLQGEQVVEENGLFHPLFWAIRGPDPAVLTGPERSFGRLSLHQDLPVLRRYLEAERKRCTAPLLLERGSHVQMVLDALNRDLAPRKSA